MDLKLIKLIIGLGNPNEKYINTYHNVGLLFVEYLKNQILYPMPYTLLASNVYMNKSGLFIAKTLKKSNAKPEEILIVHDDSDLELGTYKFQFGRGAAGHHGVESVIKALKTKNFWRLRVGIRPKLKEGAPRLRAEKFVLKKITAADKKTLEKVFEEITEKL